MAHNLFFAAFKFGDFNWSIRFVVSFLPEASLALVVDLSQELGGGWKGVRLRLLHLLSKGQFFVEIKFY